MTATYPSSQPAGVLQRLTRLVRHRWAEGALRRAFPQDLIERLTRRVAASAPVAVGV